MHAELQCSTMDSSQGPMMNGGPGQSSFQADISGASHQDNGRQKQSVPVQAAFVHYASPHMSQAPPKPSRFPPGFDALPASTQDILRQIGENRNIVQGSPEWVAAREKVMKQMAMAQGPSSTASAASQSTAPASAATPKQPTSTNATRGRPRGRPKGSGTKRNEQPSSSTPSSTIRLAPPVKIENATPTKARSSRGGRTKSTARARGPKRHKRKRSDNDSAGEQTPDSLDESDDEGSKSEQFPLVTKSGRSVQKPSSFVPTTIASGTPDAGSRRQRRPKPQKGEQLIFCVKCLRGHSPPSNEIVICDGCNDGYHQWCHDPVITQDVIAEISKSWFCGKCQHAKEVESVPLDRRVSGLEMSKKERDYYLSTLSADTLLSLLMHATHIHPDLPIFPPSATGSERSSQAPQQRTRQSPQTQQGQQQHTGQYVSSAVHNTVPMSGRQASTTAQNNQIPTHTAQPPQAPRQSSIPAQTPQPFASSNLSAPQDARPQTSGSATSSSRLSSPAPSTALSAPSIDQPTTHIPPERQSEAINEEDEDPYSEYNNAWNDPPSTYPRPGQGPYKIRSTTDPTALNWLLDDNDEVFSHWVTDGKGGLVKLDRSGPRGDWVGRLQVDARAGVESMEVG